MSEEPVGEVSTGTLRHRAVKISVSSDDEATKDLEANKTGNKPEESDDEAIITKGIESKQSEAKQSVRVRPSSAFFTERDILVGDDEILSFPKNTFSFLLVARYPLCEKARPENVEGTNNPIPKHKSRDYLCIPFWSALSILTLQVLIYTLALQNATDLSDKQNPLSFPIDVDRSTRAAEFVAMLITVYTESNLFQGVDQFVQSHKDLIGTPGVTVTKYYFTATIQVLVGLYGIFVTFIIIMQAEGVVDLLLDFTAMEFVGALDEAAFVLAMGGFFGTPMKRTARAVRRARYRARDVWKWLRKWPLFLLFAAVMTCYVVIWVNQSNRAFGDNEIYVQFHDDVLPWLSTLSGVYIGCHIPSSDQSSITKGKDYTLGGTMYTTLPVSDCKENWKSEHGAFFFCDQKHWVFAVGENKMNPCENWAMKSIKPNPEGSDEYDIMTHSSEIWLAQDPSRKSGTGVVEEIQFLAGFEPSQNAGRNCSVLASTGNVFSYPFYARLEESLQRKSFSSERPVYFAGDDVDGEYIIYTGRRWVVVKASQIPTCVRNCKTSTEPCCNLDSYASNYTVSFISDPMDLRQIEDTWIPTSDLIWYKAPSGVYGNSTTPVVEKQSLVDQIDLIEALSSVGSFPTDEEQEKLIDLHLQSARLQCFCDAGDLECEKNVACDADDEITVWIDLQTDGRPQDTYFIVLGDEAWKDFKEEAASSYSFASVRQYVNDANFGITFLNNTGYFDWQNTWNADFAAKSNYQYTTCLPKNKCGFVYIEDSSGNGLTFPGRFNVYLNTRQLERDRGGRMCVYDLCQASANCSDYSLRSELYNPEVECTEESVPLALQFFKDTSLSFSDSSEWLADNLESTELVESGNVNWEPSAFDAARAIWNQLDSVGEIGDDDREYILSPFRMTTCVPKASCAIVNFDILDVPLEKVLSRDLGFPFEPPIVRFNGVEIGPGEEESTFDHCVYQFGDSCPTEIICSDREIQRPYTSNIECRDGEKPLAIQVKTDIYPEETFLFVTDLETWMNEALNGTVNLNETGTFEWGSIRWKYNEDSEQTAASYSFNTCVPDDVCGVAVLGDTYADGIANGGMTLVYDNKEILFGSQGDEFLQCAFQFGNCKTQFNCYESTNSIPPYNPAIDCQSGTPLAFELRTDFALESTIVVTDLDSWNQRLFPGFPYLGTEGNFTWGDFLISGFENGPFHRFSTCMPSDECAVVALVDARGNGIFNGGITVVYNSTEIIRGPEDVPFTVCVLQFGACETQVVCYDNELPPPSPFNPEINCTSGKSLAFEFMSDTIEDGQYSITVGDFYSWSRGILSNVSMLNETGYFEWDTVEFSDFYWGIYHRFSTCVPDGLCGIVALEDTLYEGIGLGDRFSVYYAQEEILAANATEGFRTCQYQFGSCGQEAFCNKSLPPPYNPEIECVDGKSLAFDFHPDIYFYENDLIVADRDTWVQGLWAANSSLVLKENFDFEWAISQFELGGFELARSYHFSTCVPNEVCGVVVLRDSEGDGVQTEEGLRVVYDQKEIPLTRDKADQFNFCEFQFGSCGQAAYCGF